jgi:hypothetical protein
MAYMIRYKFKLLTVDQSCISSNKEVAMPSKEESNLYAELLLAIQWHYYFVLSFQRDTVTALFLSVTISSSHDSNTFLGSLTVVMKHFFRTSISPSQ